MFCGVLKGKNILLRLVETILASEHYNESDYIIDYNEFLAENEKNT
ncbi:WxcM-like domain-containing protein [Campylobacter devanensis]|nr:WxcM-like domain-containing protein [Campylobacter sp. P160]